MSSKNVAPALKSLMVAMFATLFWVLIELHDRCIYIMDIMQFRQRRVTKITPVRSDYDPITCVVSQIRYADRPLSTWIKSGWNVLLEP